MGAGSGDSKGRIISERTTDGFVSSQAFGARRPGKRIFPVGGVEVSTDAASACLLSLGIEGNHHAGPSLLEEYGALLRAGEFAHRPFNATQANDSTQRGGDGGDGQGALFSAARSVRRLCTAFEAAAYTQPAPSGVRRLNSFQRG